jgi:hypothetical protein
MKKAPENMDTKKKIAMEKNMGFPAFTPPVKKGRKPTNAATKTAVPPWMK